MQAGENRLNKNHCVTMQRYIKDSRMVEFGLCRRRKIWIPAAKFNEFCKSKFDKRRLLFFAVFVGCILVNYSAELDGYHNFGSLRDIPEPWLLK